MRIEFYNDRDGSVRWRIVARNGNIIADSGEGYSRITDARRGVERTTGRKVNLKAGYAWPTARPYVRLAADERPESLDDWAVRDLREAR